MTKDNKIYIFDTTLRDGEQSPGMSMTTPEKLLVAEILDHMGVDIIEAGFAMASDGDFEAVNEIAKITKNSVVCSLARAKTIDIERAAEAIKPAARGRIHTFISTSEIHLKHQFKMTEEEVLERIKETVTLARNYVDDVEWSAMDATRSDKEYLCKAVEVAIQNGATTVNIPDTVGYATPFTIGELISYIKNNVPNIDKAIISFHGQNDLGLATANALAAVEAGARQIECTINGIGERAGNTSLEEVVMALNVRKDVFGLTNKIKTENIMKASRLVQHITGQSVQVNKAIVGANAFAHESGIHQDGMLKNSETYEIMTPESVGLNKSNLVMGKHSGRHAFKDKLKDLGLELGDNAFEDAFNRFKALADKKKSVYDDDIISIVDGNDIGDAAVINFVSLYAKCGSSGQKVDLALEIGDKQKSAAAESNSGPVDACYKAIREIYPHEAKLLLYQVNAVTAGIDAQAEVMVRLESKAGVIMNGNGADTDTLVASVKAYIDGLNKLLSHEKKIGL